MTTPHVGLFVSHSMILLFYFFLLFFEIFCSNFFVSHCIFQHFKWVHFTFLSFPASFWNWPKLKYDRNWLIPNYFSRFRLRILKTKIFGFGWWNTKKTDQTEPITSLGFISFIYWFIFFSIISRLLLWTNNKTFKIVWRFWSITSILNAHLNAMLDEVRSLFTSDVAYHSWCHTKIGHSIISNFWCSTK